MPFPKLFVWKAVLGNVISGWGEVSCSLRFVPVRWLESTEIRLKQLNRISSWFFIFNAYHLLPMPIFGQLYSPSLYLDPNGPLKFYFAIKKVMVGRLKSVANSSPHGNFNFKKKNPTTTTTPCIFEVGSQLLYVSNSYKTFT